MRRIGANVNQVARALNVAVARGKYPPRQGEAAREAAELVRSEMRRVVAAMTGNWDYWGLPWANRPMPAPGAEDREDERTRAEMDRRRLRSRRPKRFRDDADALLGDKLEGVRGKRGWKRVLLRLAGVAAPRRRHSV